MPTQQIPDKLYFRIGEVAAIVGVKSHVLRYWEEEFPSLRPAQNPAQQTVDRRNQIEIFFGQKKLIY
jgi:DNA-binding transcriptional MerR regulator